MQIYDMERIRTVVNGLKEARLYAFTGNKGLVDVRQATEACRIVDTFMLPLYFIWEHCCKRKLIELAFENYLEQPYRKFEQNPITSTWELYLFISTQTPFDRVLRNKNLSKEITNIYKHFINAEGGGKEHISDT